MAKTNSSDELENSPEYQEWKEQQEFTDVNTKKVTKNVLNDLKMTKSMSQFEYTLWQTYHQLHQLYGNADKDTLEKINQVKNKIWMPVKPDDYLKLEPELVLVHQQFPIRRVSIWGNERYAFMTNPDPLAADWTILGHFVSTGRGGGMVGRNHRFIVRDKISKKYLGIICLSSDLLDLKGRDEKIGWSRDIKTNQKMINHTASGSVIVPTQPFGYNYVGGKLLSLLLLSNTVSDVWKEIHGDKLVGISTTSLYGKEKSATQYDGLKYWKKYGYSKGSTGYKPSPQTNISLKNWMLNKYPIKYYEFYQAKRDNGLPLKRDSLERARLFCYEKLALPTKETKSNHLRGIYFSELYTNTFEYLRKEITDEALEPAFDNSVEALVEIWKEKYVSKRVKSLVKKDAFSFEPSFYDELLTLSWDQTKERYLQ